MFAIMRRIMQSTNVYKHRADTTQQYVGLDRTTENAAITENISHNPSVIHTI